MMKVKSCGKGITRSNLVGQNEYWRSSAGRQHTMAVWSSEPPKVPTPIAPGSSGPQSCPFSMQPR
eukprot:scaffold268788_cov31-Tisochrysis_lutea.AAC.6